MAPAQVTLGRVAGVFGVRGWLRIASQTRPADRILEYRRWWVGREDQGYQARVMHGHAHGSGVVVQLTDSDGEAIDDRDVAAALVGSEIRVDRADLPKLPDGSFYWIDLIGQNVVNTADVPLGTVKDVTSNGAQDVLVIDGGDGRERLIPFVQGPIVKDVNLAAGRIVCDWEPEF